MPGEKLIQSANIWLSCTNYVISAELLWWIRLISTQEGSLNCKNISKCGKRWKLKYRIVASTINPAKIFFHYRSCNIKTLHCGIRGSALFIRDVGYVFPWWKQIWSSCLTLHFCSFHPRLVDHDVVVQIYHCCLVLILWWNAKSQKILRSSSILGDRTWLMWFQ